MKKLLGELADLCFIDIETREMHCTLQHLQNQLVLSDSWKEWRSTGNMIHVTVRKDIPGWCHSLTTWLGYPHYFPPREEWIADRTPVIWRMLHDLFPIMVRIQKCKAE